MSGRRRKKSQDNRLIQRKRDVMQTTQGNIYLDVPSTPIYMWDVQRNLMRIYRLVGNLFKKCRDLISCLCHRHKLIFDVNECIKKFRQKLRIIQNFVLVGFIISVKWVKVIGYIKLVNRKVECVLFATLLLVPPLRTKWS